MSKMHDNVAWVSWDNGKLTKQTTDVTKKNEKLHPFKKIERNVLSLGRQLGKSVIDDEQSNFSLKLTLLMNKLKEFSQTFCVKYLSRCDSSLHSIDWQKNYFVLKAKGSEIDFFFFFKCVLNFFLKGSSRIFCLFFNFLDGI